MSTWYVIVDADGRYLPYVGEDNRWVQDVRAAAIFTSLGQQHTEE